MNNCKYSFLKIGAWNIEGAYFKVNNFYVNKLREPEFLKNIQAHDILCVQETHCGPQDIPSQHLSQFKSIPHCRKKSSNNRYFGGMLLLVRKTVRAGVKVTYTDDSDILGITLKKEFFSLSEDLQVWFVYAPPANSPYARNRGSTISKLEELLASNATSQHLILGDLNGRTAREDDFISETYDTHSPTHHVRLNALDAPPPRRNMDSHPPDEHGKLIINLCKTFQIRILNGRSPGDRWGNPTRYPINQAEKPSTIDYGICSHSLFPLVRSFYVLPFTSLSDHCCISVGLSTIFLPDEPSPAKEPSQPSGITYSPSFQLSQVDKYQRNLSQDPTFGKLLLEIRNHDADQTTQDKVDEWASSFNNSIVDNARKSFVMKRVASEKKNLKRPQRPAAWYNDNCIRAKNSLRRATNRLNKDPYNRSLQEQLVGRRKHYKKTCKEAESENRKRLLTKLLTTSDPKKFWGMIKDMKGYGREREDPSDSIAPSTWEEYFKDLLNTKPSQQEPPAPDLTIPSTNTSTTSLTNPPTTLPPDSPNILPTNSPTKPSTNLPTIPSTNPVLPSVPTLPTVLPAGPIRPHARELDVRITMKELRAALHKIKIGKAHGPDGILTEFIKYAPTNVIETLLEMMNAIFSNSIYPSAWTVNFLKAIFKSGPTDDPGNYRGLAIGAAIAKLYSLILLSRLENYISDNKIITKNQIGFLRGFRTADHIYVLKTIISKYTKNNGRLYAAFIDFKKAYDTVNRDILLQSLNNYGIGGKMWASIGAIYSKVQYSIRTKHATLDPILSNLGLKQGCPLSPLLFNLYINDLARYLGGGKGGVELHGEDLTHFLYADDLVIVSATKAGLQEKLNGLGLFADSKDLTINTKKSKIMVFNKGGRTLRKEHCTIKGEKLEVVSKYTYLGVEIPSSGSFCTSIGELTSKAKRAMMPLFTTIMQFNIPFRKALQLFRTYVEPILLYNSENQTAMTDKQIEKCKRSKTHIYDIINKSPLTTTQLKFTKFVMGVGKYCPSMVIFGESASLPLLMKAHIHMLKFWSRIREMDDQTLVKLAYRENLAMNARQSRSSTLLLTSIADRLEVRISLT